MIGIYKITNKLNGKSYIGQSIHCGKRLDEHCKGNQFIDEIIQLEGVKNFTFEILKDVEKESLSKWEDYYIMKYDTMFPNGYNKRWNCNEDIRQELFFRLKQENISSKNIYMPKKEEDILNNSMKLFAYLSTISGLASYPPNTRMFRQKNLMPSRVKTATGITEKTTKLYLYYLEENGLLKFQGENQFNFLLRSDYDSASIYRKAAQDEAIRVWNLRQKERDSTYLIPRPLPFTPIPEQTLKRLNEDFKITELEMEIYLFLCAYRDECVQKGLSYKAMTYENFREILNLKKHTDNHKNIFTALAFLEKVGLIIFDIGSIPNSRGAEIPVFQIREVNYYITQTFKSFDESELITEEEKQDLKKMFKRVQEGFNKQEEIVN